MAIGKTSKPSKTRDKKANGHGDLAPERIAAILMGLDEAYPGAECALIHRSPWELLVATILGAVHRCARQSSHAGAVQALPHSGGDGESKTARA